MRSDKTRDYVLSVRLNKQEKAEVDYLTEELQRDRADVIRFIVCEKVKELRATNDPPPKG